MDQEKLGKGAEQVFIEKVTHEPQQGHGGQWKDPRVRTGYEQFAAISETQKGHERKKAGDFNDPFCEAGKPVNSLGHERVDKEHESKKEDDHLGEKTAPKTEAHDEHHSILGGVKDFISHGVEKAKGMFTPSTETSQLTGEKEKVEREKPKLEKEPAQRDLLKGEREEGEQEKRVEQTH